MRNVILNCSRLVSVLFKHNVKPTSIGAFSDARLISNTCTRYTGSSLYRPYTTCVSSHHRYLSAYHHHRTTRHFSDLLTDNVSNENSPQTQHKFNIDVMVSLLRQENAVDICVIKVPDEVKYTDYFIVVTGSSTRHLRAMALYVNKVYKSMRKDGDPYSKIEGKDTEDWLCIDFGHMVVHFMVPEARELYELEKLWTLRSLDEQFCSIPPETLPEDYMYGAEITK